MVLLTALQAQLPLPRDGWLLGSSGTDFALLSPNFGVLAAQLHTTYSGLYAPNADIDERGIVYTAGGPVVYRWTYDPLHTPGLIAFPYTAPWFTSLTSAVTGFRTLMVSLRDGIWLLYEDARVGHISKDIPSTTIAIRGTSWPGAGAIGWWCCTDGRELFFSAPVDASHPYHIYAVDFRAPTVSIRPVAQLPLGPNAAVLAAPAPLQLGRSGKILALGEAMVWEVDATTGSVTALKSISSPRIPPMPPPPTWRFAYNPWNDLALACPSDPQRMEVIWSQLHDPSSTWSLAYSDPFWWAFPYAIPGQLLSTSERPFELFGAGCANTTGRDPRLGWQGLPLEGQTFSIDLRSAEPNGFAVFWLGLSDTFWPGVGALPFDAAPFGAPGCMLLVAADVTHPVWVDGNGNAPLNVSVPVNPSLRGLEVFAQSASSSGANSLGFAASDALVIRIR